MVARIGTARRIRCSAKVRSLLEVKRTSEGPTVLLQSANPPVTAHRRKAGTAQTRYGKTLSIGLTCSTTNSERDAIDCDGLRKRF